MTVSARKVLVVEDNSDIRDAMTAVLQLSQHQVVSVPDGESALKAASQDRFDVALIDIDLPGISGYDVAASLRASARTANMRLIAVTGYGQDSDRAQALANGFDAHLTKPVQINDLIRSFQP